MASYEAFTAEEARHMSKCTFTRKELDEAMEREHKSIRDAAAQGQRKAPMYHYGQDALGNELRSVLRDEGYKIYDESEVMGGVRQEPYPYIHW